MFVHMRRDVQSAVRSLRALHWLRKQTWRQGEAEGRRGCCMRVGPPWRVLFLGSDDFAVESLKLLTHSSEKIVERLEVVAVSSNVPVRSFAEENNLRVHTWPPQDLDGRFDVGVVVSFGCLLPEKLISTFPYGILNLHPSLLPRWRGAAPILHTIMHGDAVTAVTIMQICAHRFDVGPILNQQLHQIPEKCTAEELGAVLAKKGAELLIDTLKTLPQRIANKRDQSQTGVTFAPKIRKSLSWMVWEEQTCHQIDCLFRAIGSRIPLQTIWMGRTLKLLDFVGKCHISFADERKTPVPGSVTYLRESNTLAVCCKDGWVGFKTVVLKKRLTAGDFYNGYLHQEVKRTNPQNTTEARGLFISKKIQKKRKVSGAVMKSH